MTQMTNAQGYHSQLSVHHAQNLGGGVSGDPF